MADFTAQLGKAEHPRLLDREQRLDRIEHDHNPYVTGSTLAPNSPVFFGRERGACRDVGRAAPPGQTG